MNCTLSSINTSMNSHSSSEFWERSRSDAEFQISQSRYYQLCPSLSLYSLFIPCNSSLVRAKCSRFDKLKHLQCFKVNNFEKNLVHYDNQLKEAAKNNVWSADRGEISKMRTQRKRKPKSENVRTTLKILP